MSVNATQNRQILKRSVKLTDEEVEMIREKAAQYDTQIEAAIELKIGKDTLVRLLQFKSCSEATYQKLFHNQINN